MDTAPSALVSWMAAVPVPPLAPKISTCSPGLVWVRVTSMRHTVSMALLVTAASLQVKWAGLGRHCAACTRAYWENAPISGPV
ncbi:MAG: hypothetical protein C0487_16860 [Leptothrix sp. (in: Bacteria)]|nr:hypothetical protein [Leptothrix sp. (in: b-proteobacteria)]